MGATVLTVPEPQQLSPLLQKISPPFAISSFPNVITTSSSYMPSNSPYPPNTPSTPRTPATPINDSTSNKGDAADSVTKEKKPKKPKLTKQEREKNKLMREQKKKLQDKKEQQWKILQQQRIFEQQRQAILNQSKAMAMDATMHPSQRFNATMNSKLADDAFQHSLLMKSKATNQNPVDLFSFGQASTISGPHHSAPTVTTVNSIINTSSPSLHQQHSHDVTMSSTSDTMFSSQQYPSTTVAKSADQAKSSSISTRSGSTPIQQPPQMQLPQSPHPFSGKPPGMYGAGSSRLPGQEAFPEDLVNMDPLHMRSTEQQQKAFLFQQQYMASQQQYIQWQLSAQQAAGNMYMQQGSKPKPNADGKDLQGSEGDDHDRMQMFLNHRQMHNESAPHFMKSPIDKPGSGEKRGHPDFPLGMNQPFPPIQDGRLNGGMMAGGSRLPPLPSNSSQEAVYQKMLMEMIMRYREIPTAPSQIPPNQLHMMAEVARACYRNQLEKGFPQPPHPQKPLPPREPHIDPGIHHRGDPHLPPGWPPGVPFDWGRVPLPPVAENARNRLIRQPGAPVPPTSTFSPPKTQTPPSSSSSSSQMKGSHGGLPKSASFQISRIAADSTSNDDFPNTSSVGESAF